MFDQGDIIWVEGRETPLRVEDVDGDILICEAMNGGCERETDIRIHISKAREF